MTIKSAITAYVDAGGLQGKIGILDVIALPGRSVGLLIHDEEGGHRAVTASELKQAAMSLNTIAKALEIAQ